MSGSATILAIAIVIPWTPRPELSPNASRRVPRGMIVRLTQEQRVVWYYAACAAWSGESPLFVGPTRCRITVRWEKGRKQMDGDNLLSGCKRGLDQLQAAGIVLDDKLLRFEPVVQERDGFGVGETVVELWADDGAVELTAHPQRGEGEA